MEASNMQQSIKLSPDACLLRRRRAKKLKPPWWTDELTNTRRLVRAAARHRRCPGLSEEYNALRNNYTSILRRTKIQTWRKFCTDEGKLPWGRLYRWLRSGKRHQGVPALMVKQDGTRCTNVDESVQYLSQYLDS